MRARRRSTTATRPGPPALRGQHGEPLERGDDVLAREPSFEPLPAVELVEQARDRLVRAQVVARGLADRRPLGAVGTADERGCGIAGRGDRVLLGAERVDDGQPRASEHLDLGVDALRRCDPAAAQASLDVVGVRAGEPGVRRADVAEELAPAAAEPGEAEQRQQRAPVRRGLEAGRRLDGVRDAERAEGGLERRLEAVDRRADDADPLGRRAAADQLEDLVADELERAARAGALEEADRALDRRRGRRRVGEERPLDVRDRGMGDVVEGGRQLLDARPGERGQLLGGGAERREGGAAGLVRERDGHVGAAGERLRRAATRPRSGPRSRTRRRAGPARRRGRPRAAARRARAGDRDPRARSGRAPRGRRRTGGRGRRRRRRARRARRRARAPRRAAPRRSRSSAPRRRGRSARPARSRGGAGASAGRRWRAAVRRGGRSAGTGRRRCRSSRRRARPTAPPAPARPARRPTRSARSGTGRDPERPHSAPGAARPCRHSPARRPARGSPAHRTDAFGRRPSGAFCEFPKSGKSVLARSDPASTTCTRRATERHVRAGHVPPDLALPTRVGSRSTLVTRFEPIHEVRTRPCQNGGSSSWYRYCVRPAASTPVAWSFAPGRGEIQTSRHAGGITSSSIRASCSGSVMRCPRPST